MISFTYDELQTAAAALVHDAERLRLLSEEPRANKSYLINAAEERAAAAKKAVEIMVEMNDEAGVDGRYKIAPFTISDVPTGYKVFDSKLGAWQTADAVVRQFVFDSYKEGDRARALRDARTLARLMNQPC